VPEEFSELRLTSVFSDFFSSAISWFSGEDLFRGRLGAKLMGTPSILGSIGIIDLGKIPPRSLGNKGLRAKYYAIRGYEDFAYC
jgi:hypothetical protein